MEPRSATREIAGRPLTLETGRLAKQANSVLVTYGDTVVLVTAVASPTPREGVDFLPLTVDYEERLYAAGKIPGGFIRREGRPSQEAILASRLTDRTIRPLLPKTWRREIQVIVTVLSTDQENDPNLLAIVGASSALSMSEIPFAGPVSGVTVGYLDGQMVLNPTLPQLAVSSLDLVVCSSRKDIVMVEAGAREIPEDIIGEAMKFGHEANQAIIDLQEEFLQGIQKPKDEAPPAWNKPEVESAVANIAVKKMDTIIGQSDKQARGDATENLRKEIIEQLKETCEECDINIAFENIMKQVLRSTVLDKSTRVDGRGLTELRPISCSVGLLPRTHGSGLFNRGETQVMSITTLGAMSERQQLDGLGIEETKHYMHHYNFPPFSTGEAKRAGVTGRREYGHGALAERALLPVVPIDEEFPYTVRLVSEALSSNGSTSMASCCASTMSLMDAGIKIKAPVAGISIGLVTGEDGKYALLTDIEGMEDNYGDMDYKIAGTADGITAVQLDMKPKGISADILIDALKPAREARMFILDKMLQTISESKPELSPYAPRMYKVAIPADKIGTVIGPGGKTIRSIVEESKATVDINNEGIAIIGSADEASARKAMDMIDALIRDVEVGAIYTGKVTRIMNFGAFVEVLPGKDGMVHISELADYRVDKVEDVVKIGDEITVKVTEIDNQGRVNLSRRAAFSNASEKPEDRQPQRRDNFSRPPNRSNPPQNKRRF